MGTTVSSNSKKPSKVTYEPVNKQTKEITLEHYDVEEMDVSDIFRQSLLWFKPLPSNIGVIPDLACIAATLDIQEIALEDIHLAIEDSYIPSLPIQLTRPIPWWKPLPGNVPTCRSHPGYTGAHRLCHSQI
ncbi:uncharacterized protein [Amphiura filiformis]|uniref:uncharacterized protein n=1 Tax=Amphiura filiformis TaxID=82378 RepID=UPI003B2228A2